MNQHQGEIQQQTTGAVATAESCILQSRAWPGSNDERVVAVCVESLAIGGQSNSARSQHAQSHIDLIAGLYENLESWTYLVLGDTRAVRFYFIFSQDRISVDHWPRTLASHFPGGQFNVRRDVSEILTHLARCRTAASLTGNPHPDTVGNPGSDRSNENRRCLESVIRAMPMAPWAYAVSAKRVGHPEIEEEIRQLDNAEREIVGARMRLGTAEERNNPAASQQVDLLHHAREKRLSGRQLGMWDVRVQLLAEDRHRLVPGVHAMKATFSGDQSLPQPVRITTGDWDDRTASTVPTTRVCTTEAAQFARLPMEEYPGYGIRKFVRFAASPPPSAKSGSIELGRVQEHYADAVNAFTVAPSELCKHALVAGVTGSGKTNTCQHFLRQLWGAFRIPWLVIEPSMKCDYRRLATQEGGDDIRVYTLGDETCVPFRMNPLEVMPGVHVQTHIDSLSALFNASFALVTPMPYVLNLALHRVYLDFGWDLALGWHRRGHVPDVQPTLLDLLHAVNQEVESLGYDSQISANIRAGLGARLRSLMVGGKGAMLNTRVSMPMKELLKNPCVLELAALGDDDEKAFVMASVLLRLIEFRQCEGSSRGRLLHATLLEEAHRLLRRVPDVVSSEYANPRGKAVETFCNMLSECRDYGEGLIIAEQIPSKLASDVIKSTNLKIVHRIVAQDDRLIVGGSMNLNDDQQGRLATLTCGEAIVYKEGCESAYLVRVPGPTHDSRMRESSPDKAWIVSHMKRKGGSENACNAHPTDCWVAPRADFCAGCIETTCPARRLVVQELLTRNHATGFIDSLDGGWHSIWAFGMRVAGTLVQERESQEHVAQCFLMTLAKSAGFDKSQMRKFIRNLNAMMTQKMEEAE